MWSLMRYLLDTYRFVLPLTDILTRPLSHHAAMAATVTTLLVAGPALAQPAAGEAGTAEVAPVPTATAEAPATTATESTDVFAAPATSTATPVPAPQNRKRLITPWYSAGATLSRNGASGLIRMPNANVVPDGEARLVSFGLKLGPTTNLVRLGNSSRYAGSIGFLPGLEIGATVGNELQGGDLTTNFKYQVLRENRKRPAVALGVTELSKLVGFDPSFYGVAGKSAFQERVNFTAGVIHNPNFKNTRAFGGVEVGIVRGVSAVAEYDTNDINAGIRAGLWKDRIQVAFQRFEKKWVWQAGLRVPLGRRPDTTPVGTLPRLGDELTAPQSAKAVQQRLVEIGLENVLVQLFPAGGATTGGATAEGASLVMETRYENRSFAHNEMDALANVLAAMAAYAPPGVEQLRVEIKRSAIPVLRVTCPLQAYRDFFAGEMDTQAFRAAFDVDQTQNPKAGPEGETVANSGTASVSYGHADLFLRPGVRLSIGTEQYTVAGILSLQPELEVPVTQGLGVNVRGNIPLAGPFRGNDVTLDRAALNYSFNAGPSLLGRVYAGRFPGTYIYERQDGVMSELVYRPERGRWSLRASAGTTKRRDTFFGTPTPGNTTLLGEARYLYPKLDLRARLSGGRYLEGDEGFVGGVVRRFGDTEVGLEIRDTNRGRAGVLSLGIALGPDHVSSRPDTLRLRPPDYLDYNQRSLLTRPNFVDVALRTGNELNVGGSASRSLLDRDRLQRAYLLQYVEELRQVLPFRSAKR
jgi:hypothetical protein